MLIHSAVITGSVQFNNTDVSGITNVSSFATTASVDAVVLKTGSFATTSSVNELQSKTGSYTSTSSFGAYSSSINTFTSSATTRLNTIESVTGSFASTSSVNNLQSVTGSYASTGSNQFNGNQSISGSITSNGTITAQTLVVQTVTSSVDFITGSARFGSLAANTHQFTGSILASGSIQFSNSATITTNAGTGFLAMYANGGGLYFGGAASTNQMVISSSGNVGIGTTSPSVKLDVSDATNAIIRVNATSDGAQAALSLNGYASGGTYRASRVNFQQAGTNKWSIIQDYNQNNTNSLTFEQAGTRKVVFDADGNVGIGNNTPSAKLDVNGSAIFSTSIQSPAMYGRYFTPTSISGATAYIDTGIALENNAIYLLTVTANPAAAGGVYSYNEVGLININSQYNGSTNTQLIKFTRLSISNASVYPGNLTLSVVFLIGGSEVTQTSSYLPSGQIRIKIDGFYNAAGTNFAYLTRIG